MLGVVCLCLYDIVFMHDIVCMCLFVRVVFICVLNFVTLCAFACVSCLWVCMILCGLYVQVPDLCT